VQDSQGNELEHATRSCYWELKRPSASDSVLAARTELEADSRTPKRKGRNRPEAPFAKEKTRALQAVQQGKRGRRGSNDTQDHP